MILSGQAGATTTGVQGFLDSLRDFKAGIKLKQRKL